MSERGHRVDSEAPSSFSRRSLPVVILVTLTILVLMATVAIAADDEGPYLDVLEPLEGLRTNEWTVPVNGWTEPGAAIIITTSNGNNSRTYQEQPEPNGYFDDRVLVFEGWNRISITSSLYGMEVTTVLRKVWVDRTPPDLVIFGPEGSPVYTNSDSYEIAGMVVLDPETVVVSLVVDGLPTSYPNGQFSKVVHLRQDRNEIEVRALDELGNEAVVEVVIIADWQPPVVLIKVPEEERIVTGYGVVEVRGTVLNATRVYVEHIGHRYAAILTGGDWNNTGTWMHTLELGPRDLNVAVFVRAFDHVGNMAQDVFWVTLDLEPPELDVTYKEPNVGGHTIINVATDPDIGALDINGKLYPVVAGYASILWPLDEGANEVVITARDAVGNEARDVNSIWYDDHHLSLNVKDPPDTKGNWVIVEGTTDGNVATVLVDGEQYPVENGSFRVEVNPGEGQDLIKVVVVDPAGNTRTAHVSAGGQTLTPAVVSGLVIVGIAVLMMVFSYRYIIRRSDRPPSASR
jgi:hypothetical protein